MAETVRIYSFGDFDRSGKVRWLAEELGLAIEEQPVRPPAHREPDYLALNPLGQVPTVQFRGRTVVESTAICHHLAEAVDEPKLWIGRGEPERQAYLYWLAAFGETCEGRLVECAISKRGVIGPEYFDLHASALRRKLGVLAEQLPDEGYLAGSFLSVADVVAGYNLRLAVQTGLLERERVEPYLSRLVERPAAVRSRIFARLPQG